MNVTPAAEAATPNGATSAETGAPTLKRFDLAEMGKTMDLLDWSPGFCYEVRVLGRREVPGAPRFKTAEGYFDDPHQMIAAAVEYAGYAAGVYLIMNPLPRRFLWRCANRLDPWAETLSKDDEIAERRWLLIDIDTKQPKGVATTDEEHDYATAKGREVFEHLKQKTTGRLALCDSANGAHLLMETPCAATPENAVKAEAFLKGLARQFNDDRVFIDACTYNASRLTKFYGTLACKGDHHPVENPFRLSRILEVWNG